MNMATIAISATVFFVYCSANPVFETSDRNGGWPDGGYYVHNNMWNSARYNPCKSTLCAWSHDNWYVVTRMNNKTGDGAVKTYPNVHRDYDRVPIGSFESITSSFDETSPHVGIYNVAYDLWINGIAKPGCTEIMIWTENFNQVPGGKYVEEVTFGSQVYKVYRDRSSGYIALVAKANFTRGTVSLLDIIKWAMAKGWLSRNSSLNQICFGVEIVSTNDADSRFQVSAFSIDAKLRSRLNPTAPARDAANSSVSAGIAPQPIISRGVPAYASAGTASYGNNATYAQEGKWIPDCEWTVFSSPAWLAYDLSGVPAADRAKILVVWYGGGQAYDCSIIKGASYRMPGPYVIEGNAAAGAQKSTRDRLGDPCHRR